MMKMTENGDLKLFEKCSDFHQTKTFESLRKNQENFAPTIFFLNLIVIEILSFRNDSFC